MFNHTENKDVSSGADLFTENSHKLLKQSGAVSDQAWSDMVLEVVESGIAIIKEARSEREQDDWNGFLQRCRANGFYRELSSGEQQEAQRALLSWWHEMAVFYKKPWLSPEARRGEGEYILQRLEKGVLSERLSQLFMALIVVGYRGPYYLGGEHRLEKHILAVQKVWGQN
jgi:hypothetical protein